MFQSQSQNIKEHSVRIVSTAFLLFFLILVLLMFNVYLLHFE